MMRSKEAGFDAHLTKPLDFANLQGLLTTLPRPAYSEPRP
jgi:hypothetical protein